MPELRFLTEINRPTEAVFNLLGDFANYSRWLPSSNTWAETVNISDSPVNVGTKYIDKYRFTILHIIGYGEVTEYEPSSRIVFHQATKIPGLSLDITIHYNLSATNGNTRLTRMTTVVMAGFLRVLQSVIVRKIRRENERTIQALKDYLETEQH